MSFAISDVETGGLKSAVGLDEKRPLFAWKLVSDKNNVKQTEVRVTVGSRQGESDMWDSGAIRTDCPAVEYAGKELAACSVYFVRLTVKNNYGETAQADRKFETAFLSGDRIAWEGAEFIGAPEYYVCGEALGVFCLESGIRIDGDGRAGVLFGADDYRLLNRECNEMRMEGENYILVCIHREHPAEMLEIFRRGYSREDRADVPFFCAALPRQAGDGLYRLKLDVTGNCVRLNVNGVFIRQVQLNPLGDNDVTTFPRLGKIGYCTDAGTKAFFEGITLRFIREPSNVFFECDTEKGLAVHENHAVVIKRNPDCHALPMLRRNFTVRKSVERARLYAAARGIYDCRINGEPISEEYFAPGASQFDKHLYYQTYDITRFVHAGDNGIAFTLASGWWSGSQTFVLGCFNFWGDQESVMAKLVITYTDGSADTYVTNDREWAYYGEGAYKFGGFFQGERLDGRQLKEFENFSKPDFACENLKKPKIVVPPVIPAYDPLPGFFRAYPSVNVGEPELTGRPHCPVKAAETFTAVSRTSFAEGFYLYDLGQEIAGVPQITFHGKEGETAVIRYGEMLYPDMEEYGELAGRLLTANLRDASSTDKYILSGDDVEVYSPKFTFHGFRYIEISGVENPPKAEEVKGIQLSSLQGITGEIRTDHALLNRFIQNVKYSQLCNSISIPTDCPQRNERMGWAGDTHVFCKTACMNADVKNFYLRYLEALRDGQEENGNLPEIAPVGGGFGGIAYGSCLHFMVNDLYSFYGDKRIISENYTAMKRYMAYLAGKELPGAADMGPIDDWLAPEKTDSHLVWNAFYGRDCWLMARFADILGFAEDRRDFENRFIEAKVYFNAVFFDRKAGRTLNMDGSINDTMGGYAIGLAYKLFDDENAGKAYKRLAEKARESGFRITTGFFATGLVNPMLSEGGFGEEAYRMMTQTAFPSWLYPVTQGATTIWERWDGYTREKGFGSMNAMNSFNHYSLGSVLGWLYEYALGIRKKDDGAGWQHFIIQPDFKGFSEISGGFETPFGRIESGYKAADGKVRFFCTVPVNTEAELVLPWETKHVGSGTYSFEFPCVPCSGGEAAGSLKRS